MVNTACYAMLRRFLRWALLEDLHPAVVYEDSNPRPHQSINATVVQQIAIKMWPIMCDCIELQHYTRLSSVWKKEEKLTKDKSLSLARLAEVCPTLDVRNNNDAAEAVLFGYYFKTKVNVNYGSEA